MNTKYKPHLKRSVRRENTIEKLGYWVLKSFKQPTISQQVQLIIDS